MTDLLRRIWRRAGSLEHRSALAQRVVGSTRGLVDRVMPHRGVGTILDFADATLSADGVGAEVFVACDVTSLPAAHLLAERQDAIVVADVREVPDLSARSLPKVIPPTDMAFINAALHDFLRRCDRVITVGPSLGRLLEASGVEPIVVPNYLHPEPPVPDGELRSRLGVGEHVTVLAVPNTIVAVAEGLLEGVAALDRPIVVAFVGNTKPAAYRERLERLAAELGIDERVHWISPIAYDRLTPFLAGADAAAMVLDPTIPNHRFSYPNRVFDALAAHLPVVSSPIDDIAELVDRFGCGRVCETNDGAAWAGALASIDIDACREAAGRAAQTLTWASVEPRLFEAIPAGTASVTFLHPAGLETNQRTLRMARSLVTTGTSVTVATGTNAQAGPIEAGIRLVPIRY